MNNWFESHGTIPGWVMLMVNLWKWTRRGVRRAMPVVKRGAAAVAGWVTLRVVYLYFRFFASKEVLEEVGKVVVCIAIGYVIGKVMKDLPKSEPSASGHAEWPTWA
jgi:hypothetical protein